MTASGEETAETQAGSATGSGVDVAAAAPVAEDVAATGPPRHGGRRFLAGLLATLAVVATFATALSWWIYDIAIDTNTLVGKSEEIAENPAVRRAVNTAIVTALFSICTGGEVPKQGDKPCKPAVEQFVEERLPEQFQKYAPAAVGGMQSLVLDGLNRWNYAATLAPLWTVALEGAHQDLLDPNSDGITIGLSDVLVFLRNEFGITNLNWIQNLPIPAEYTSYTVLERSDAPIVWQAVIWIQDAAWMLPLATVVLLGTALVVSTGRLKLLSNYAIAVAVLTLLAGLGIGFTRSMVVDGIPNSLNRDAAAAVWQIMVTNTMRSAMWTMFIVSVVVAVVARLLASPRVRDAIVRAANALWRWVTELWAALTGKTKEFAERRRKAAESRAEGAEEHEVREAGEGEAGEGETSDAAAAAEGAEPGRAAAMADSATQMLERSAEWVEPRKAMLRWVGGAVAAVLFLVWPGKTFGVFLTFAVLYGLWFAALELVLLGGRKARQAQESGAEEERAESGGAVPVALPPAAVSPERVARPLTHGQLDTLERLAEMHAKGVLTDAEFAEQKARVLGNTVAAAPA